MELETWHDQRPSHPTASTALDQARSAEHSAYTAYLRACDELDQAGIDRAWAVYVTARKAQQFQEWLEYARPTELHIESAARIAKQYQEA